MLAVETPIMTFEPNSGLSQAEVQEHVDSAIENNEIVLFMKGNRHMPQCGYSDRALTLLGKYRDEFETVDVLESLDEYRAALEEHSGWETIPQTFVDGEFIGGSDVLAELEERGNLAEELGADPASGTAETPSEPAEQSSEAPF